MTAEEFYNSTYWDALISAPLELTRVEEDAIVRIPYKEACQEWWKNITNSNKSIIMSMPNFDADVFFEITGIKVEGGQLD